MDRKLSHTPVRWTYENQAALAFLDFGVGDVRAEVRALRLHRVELLRNLPTIVRRETLASGGPYLAGNGGLRWRETEEDEGVVDTLLRAKGK